MNNKKIIIYRCNINPSILIYEKNQISIMKLGILCIHYTCVIGSIYRSNINGSHYLIQIQESKIDINRITAELELV